MKRVILTAIVALLAATMASAQLFVGGSVGFDGTSTNTPIGSGEDESFVDNFAWRVSPVVGYSFSEKLLVGLAFGFGTDVPNTSTSLTTGNTTTESSTSNFQWSIAPMVRYTAFSLGKLGIAAEARVGVMGTSSKSEAMGTSTDGLATFSLGLNVLPVVTYDLSDRLQLFTNLSFLNLYVTHATSGLPDAKRKTSVTTYGLGADANSLFTTGNISVGAVWRF